MVSRREFLQSTTFGMGIGCVLQAQSTFAFNTRGAALSTETLAAAEARFPYFKSIPVSYLHVKMHDRFWAPRQKAAHQVSVPWATRHWDRAGGLEALRKDPTHYTTLIHAGDIEAIKFIETMASVVGLNRDSAIERLIDSWGQRVIDSQAADGYPTFCYPMATEPAKRWQPTWLSHEAYSLGHYIEAAIAYREATGSELMYQSALRAADHMVTTFLDNERPYAPGHAEVEHALMRLYGVTGDTQYLQLCGWFIAQRGNHKGRASLGKYAQDHLPVKQQRTIEGHAVRAAYLFNGVTEYVGATGDTEYQEAVLALWDDLVDNKLYVHGATGSLRAKNEGYSTRANYLPLDDTYGESCSVFANFQWAHNLFHLTGDARYLDDAERMLYNALYASLSLSGDRFFYRNVVETQEPTMRVGWHAVPCCPPNILKLLCKVGGFFYSTDSQGIFIKHYGTSVAQIPWGQGVKVIQRTDFPWDGNIKVHLEVERPTTLALRLRIPNWASTHRLSVNGREIDNLPQRGWVSIQREWRSRDTIELSLPMEINRITMPARFKDYAHRAALRRGPIVYCLEEQDLAAAPFAYPWLPQDVAFRAEYQADFLGGVAVLKGDIQQSSFIDGTESSLPITLVPYGVWSNRKPGGMRVWLPTQKISLDDLQSLGPPSGDIVC